MSDEPSARDDFKQGLSLLFRAVRGTVKKVDIGKIDRTLDHAITHATRLASSVGRVVKDEIQRVKESASSRKSDTSGSEPAPRSTSQQSAVDKDAQSEHEAGGSNDAGRGE